MAINKAGVELLKADLRANAAAYKQSTFGAVTECGTEQCMAGFCRIREVGREQYVAEVAREDLYDLCLSSGAQQLGIKSFDPKIFDHNSNWPYDLREAYRKARTAAARVEVACAALDRLQDDGTIAEVSL
jgi:hypothetical protein